MRDGPAVAAALLLALGAAAVEDDRPRRSGALLRALAQALDAYQIEQNFLPRVAEASALPQALGQPGLAMKDAWGRPFRYSVAGEPGHDGYVVWSGGEDGLDEHEWARCAAGCGDWIGPAELPAQDLAVANGQVIRFAAGGLAPGERERERILQTRNLLRSLGSAIDSYHVDNAMYPNVAALAEMRPLLVPTFVRSWSLTDGWGRALVYAPRGRSMALWSMGSDGVSERDWAACLPDCGEDGQPAPDEGADQVWVSPRLVLRGGPGDPTTEAERLERARADLRSIGSALESYRVDNGFYPQAASLAEARAYLAPTFLHRLPIHDAWGRPYRFRGEGERYSITSSSAPLGYADGRLTVGAELGLSGEALERDRVKRTAAALRSIATAIESFQVDEGRLPAAATLSDLERRLVPTWSREIEQTDGWGRALGFALRGEAYVIWSEGADGAAERDWSVCLDGCEGLLGETSGAAGDLVYASGMFVRSPGAR